MSGEPERAELSKVAYVLVIVGGILLFLFGLLSVLGISLNAHAPGAVFMWEFSVGFVTLVCGIIAIICAHWVCTIVWGIALLVIGIIGGGIGGVLVIIGAIIGLLVAATSK